MLPIDTDILLKMAENHCHQTVRRIEKIPQSGSVRLYFRIYLEDETTLMGVFNDDVSENRAFFEYTRFFASQGVNVPQLLTIHENEKYYLLNDLGNETLFSFLTRHRNGQQLTPEIIDFYKKTITQLPLIQLSGRKGFDFSKAYPRAAFDRQSMQWDLNYFKYYFVKLAKITFDEQKLEDDFQTLMNFLLQCEDDFFLYRDFQSRNIMIHQNQVYFIDYQGGRKGSYFYDIASLLFDGKADLSFEDRENFLDFYLSELQKHITVDTKLFRKRFYAFALIRIMQAMGAYGYRGYFEKKSHFLQSIPFAMTNIKYLIAEDRLPEDINYLKNILYQLTLVDWTFYTGGKAPDKNDTRLKVLVQSFSYKKGIPQDPSENGGGFVFDCRSLPNPGREPQYRTFTGKDACVIDYMNNYAETERFANLLNDIMDGAVDNYIERGFTHLMASCGCTGGQHRSVFFAESIARHLKGKYPDIVVELRHRDCPY
ncbi:MAG: phosphotransferase [Bacteroidales bacterium]|nr:phosphotransferase [Bacteroidales bacterium]